MFRLFLAALLFSPIVSASTLFSDDKSYYEQINDWFQKSKVVTVSQVKSLYRGKCFYSPETGIDEVETNYLAIYEKATDSVDRGPAFPPKYEIKAMLVLEEYYSGNEEHRVNEVKRAVERDWDQLDVVLDLNSPVKYQGGIFKGEVKKYSDYLITLINITESLKCEDLKYGNQILRRLCQAFGTEVPADSHLACYFYEELE